VLKNQINKSTNSQINNKEKNRIFANRKKQHSNFSKKDGKEKEKEAADSGCER
jgi:hypothetical protein